MQKTAHQLYSEAESQAEVDGLPREMTVVAAFVEHLAALGVEQAFGVSGGAIAMFYDALVTSPIALRHFRHESGAAFAAAEAFFASGRPTAVFATTGPGMLNALNGMTAAKWDGAKVVLISGATNSAQRGRWATQETSSYTLPQDALYAEGPLFDFAVRMESAAEFPEVMRRLSLGFQRPGGFVAHICMPIQVQSSRLELPRRRAMISGGAPTATLENLERCASLLEEESFAIWVGHGAVGAADRVRELVARTGAYLFCSPRAKGVFPETDPRFVGVTGLGGHETVTEFMLQQQPRWVLVLGTRLGESTSFWDRNMLPRQGFIHVDIDPSVPGTAYPEAYTLGIQAEVGCFLESLLEILPEKPSTVRPMSLQKFPDDPSNVIRLPSYWHHLLEGRAAAETDLGSAPAGMVRPQVLMAAIQANVVDSSEARVLAEAGNSFAWCNHYLRFDEPGRYRVSSHYGSMGHCAAGVVGAALGSGGKAVAILGDGAMLMNSEVSTAVQYNAPAVWIVLNDAGYGMCRDGHHVLGLTEEETEMPEVDFVGLAGSMGADGVRVDDEADLDEALSRAMASPRPFVVDVRIDPDQPSPLLRRFESLISQGNSKHVSGWEKA